MGNYLTLIHYSSFLKGGIQDVITLWQEAFKAQDIYKEIRKDINVNYEIN